MVSLLKMGQFVLSKFYRDERRAVRAANLADRLKTRLAKLDSLEKDIGVYLTAGKAEKAQKLFKHHADEVAEINRLLEDIIRFEQASYQSDISDPEKVIKEFVHLLREHQSHLKDPALKNIITVLLNSLSQGYQELVSHIERAALEVNEVFSRELTGLKSAYSISVGDPERLAQLIEARELQKRDFDQNIKRILEQVKEGLDKIRSYLEEERVVDTSAERAFFRRKLDTWFKVGDKEFKQTKSGRWMVKEASAAKVPGVFANKKLLEESGILHYQLLETLERFTKNFRLLIDYFLERSDISKQVMGHAGYIQHRVSHCLAKLEEEFRKSLVSGKKSPELVLIERKEAASTKAAEQAALAYGQHTLANAQAARAQAKQAIAAGVATVLAAGALVGAATPERVPPTLGPSPAAVVQRAVAIPGIVEHQVKLHVTKNLNLVKHFPFDVSDQIVDQAPDIQHFFPEMLKTVTEAAKEAGYHDYWQFIKETGFALEVQLSGHACPKGGQGYNLRLSQRRAEFIEHKLAEWKARTGIPIVMTDIQAKGETGEAQILALAKKLLEKESTGDPLVQDLRQHLDLQGSRTLKYWWKWYNRYKDTKRKSQALDNLYAAIHKIAGLDALLLAPQRKAVLQVTLTYEKTEKAPETIVKLIVIDSQDIVQQLPAVAVFSEKALLTSHEAVFERTAEPVRLPKYKGPKAPPQHWKRGGGRGAVGWIGGRA